MSAAYIHLSDIHFGQEKGGVVIIHDDVKERLLDDVASLVEALPNRLINGIIISGDVVYAGKKDQYEAAGKWLDRLATGGRCKITQVQLVPGNHDIDRDAICRASELMLAEIIKHGEKCLDDFLILEKDREVLYGRFEEYRDFSEGYDCPLDREGGAAGEKTVELAPGRTLRFIGLNSALCCASKDKKGTLLLGARQRVLPRRDGEELVVICHHPLTWLRDSCEAEEYVRSRARVFISGHEHKPYFTVDPVEAGCDLMKIEAGAAVPPEADDEFTYTYNVLIFECDDSTDGLSVKIFPRVWSRTKTAFEANIGVCGADSITHKLGCPNFRRAHTSESNPTIAEDSDEISQEKEDVSSETLLSVLPEGEAIAMEDKYSFLLLRFFRDLTAAQRLTILIELGAFPKTWNGTLTHPMERRAFDSLKTIEKMSLLEQAIQKFLGSADKGESN